MITCSMEEAVTCRFVIYRNLNHTLDVNTKNLSTVRLLEYGSDWSGQYVMKDKVVMIPTQKIE